MSTEMQTKVQASPAQSFTPVQTGLLQRKYALCNTPGLVEDSERDEGEMTLQRSSAGQAGTTTMPPIVHEVLSSPGKPLESNTRSFMEPLFGHDFRRVRLHDAAPTTIQTKLTIGQPNNRYEQEADRIADQVMATPANSKIGAVPPSIRRLSGEPAGQRDTVPASVDQSLASPGTPLEPTLRQDMEHRFGYDFSRVRVHTGMVAEQSARDVNAFAFTMGHDIVFGAGQFAPGTHVGRRLIAHELTHVAQRLPFLAMCSECEDLARRRERDPERAARALLRHPVGSGFLLGERYYIRFFGNLDESYMARARRILSQWIWRRYGEFSESARSRGMAVASQVFLEVIWPNEEDWLPARLIDLGVDGERGYGFLWCTTEELASITRAVQREQTREAEREATTTTAEATSESEGTSETRDLEETRVLGHEPLRGEEFIEASQRSEGEGTTGPAGRRSAFVSQFELVAIEIAHRILDQAEDILLSEQRRYTGSNQEVEQQLAIERAPVTRTATISSYAQQRLREAEARHALEAAEEAVRERAELIESIRRFVQLQERMGVERAELTQTNVLAVRSRQALSELTARSLRAREELERRYPIVAGLSVQQLQRFFRASDVPGAIRERLDVESRLSAIRRLREGLEPGDQYSVWLYPRLVNLTRARMGVARNSLEERWITEEVRTAETVRDITDFVLTGFGIAFSLVTVAATGGVAGVAFGASAAAFVVGTVSLYRDVERYLEEQSAATFTLDPRQALSNVEPSAFWLGLSVLGLGFDVFDIASSVNRLSRTMARSLSGAVMTRPGGREQILGDLARGAEDEWLRISQEARGQFRNSEEFVGTVVSAGRRRLAEIEEELTTITPSRARASSEPEYLCEVPVEGGHVWRMRPDGRWCRFSDPEFCTLLNVMLEEADLRRLLSREQPQRNRSLLEEMLEEASFQHRNPHITESLEETMRRGPAPRRVRRPSRLRDIEPGMERYRQQPPIPRRRRVIPRPLAPTVTDSLVMGREVRSDYLSHGFHPSGPQNAIRPDPARPTVEIRQDGEIFGSYRELLGWLQDAQLSYRVQAHHVFENHFAEMFGISRNEGRSIALLQEEHAQFTAEMGRIIERGTTRLHIDSIYEAHVEMYRNLGHPDWIDELRMSIRQHRDRIRQAYESGTVPGADAPDFNDRRARALEFLEGL